VRIWGQTIVPPTVTATLYFVIFGSLIGRRVGQVGGYDYMQFIAPGLIMMTVITNSYANVVSSFFGAKFGKHLEELLVSPLPNWLILTGYVAGGMLRGLLVGSAVTVVALFFTRLAVAHVFAIVSAVLLTSMVFSLGDSSTRSSPRISIRYPGSRRSCWHRSPILAASSIRSICFPIGPRLQRTPIPSCTWSAPFVSGSWARRMSI